MGIKDFYIETHPLTWGNQTVATLRGLSPDDITRLLTSESDNVQKIFEAMEAC
jgi:hypothetical protein